MTEIIHLCSNNAHEIITKIYHVPKLIIIKYICNNKISKLARCIIQIYETYNIKLVSLKMPCYITDY